MARTYDRSSSVAVWQEPPRVGSLWAIKDQPRIVVVVTAIRGPQWHQSVLWRHRNQEGLTTLKAFIEKFVVVVR